MRRMVIPISIFVPGNASVYITAISPPNTTYTVVIRANMISEVE
jgi:hypothetical protein